MSRLLVGDVFPEFTYDTPYIPQSSFYQLLAEDERPLFLVFLRNFGHPLTRHYIVNYAQSMASLLGARLACVVRSKPQSIAKHLPEGTLPFTLICDAEGTLYDFAQVPTTTKRFTCYSLAGMRILKAAAREGYQPKPNEGQQLPLTLLLEAGGKVLLAHYGTSITDQPEDCKAMQAVVEARRKELRRQAEQQQRRGGAKGQKAGGRGKKSKRQPAREDRLEPMQDPQGGDPEMEFSMEMEQSALREDLDQVKPLLDTEFQPGTFRMDAPQEEQTTEASVKPFQAEDVPAPGEGVDAEQEALRKYRDVAEALFSGGPKGP